ncbi:hypothetical protein STXM2123_1802 [Streptomyces sp. F-3]|uniref:Uncharacterized protein n=1 Tax=Streptomyces thermogriseus TaxID=75292 RepID=A0ABN1SZH5_9ACTN|nr:hypothetical protein STXM2123_1802 [Streptomyces sp. F-3]
MVDALGGSAAGLLLTDLSSEAWRILDAFEDDRYELRQVTLSTGDHGWAYTWPGGDALAQDWDAEEFRTRHLDAYAARCVQISVELAAGLRGGAR